MHEVGAWRNMAVDEVPTGSNKGSDGLWASWDGLGGSDGVRYGMAALYGILGIGSELEWSLRCLIRWRRCVGSAQRQEW